MRALQSRLESSVSPRGSVRAREYMYVEKATQAPDAAETRRLLRLIFGAIVSKALYAAAKLGIADELASGPRSVEELARRVEVDADALYRVLRALAAEGLFTEVEPRTFGLTPLGRLLST